MKKFLESLQRAAHQVTRTGRRLLLAAGIGLAACSLHAAPASIPLSIYSLTNALAGSTNYISVTNGYTPIATNANYLVNSQTFPVWRGRGFGFNAGIMSTNAAGSTLGFTVRFGNAHWVPLGGAFVWTTNWLNNANQTYNLPASTAANTNEVFDFTNIQPTSVDNVTLGQLLAITNNSGYMLYVDPSNTFVGTYP